MLGTSIVVALMSSPGDADAAIDAFEAAATACDSVVGTATQPGGLVTVSAAYEPSQTIVDAGAVEVGVAYDGSYHPTRLVMRAHDELVLVVPIETPSYQGVDVDTIATLDAQDAALDAAADG